MQSNYLKIEVPDNLANQGREIMLLTSKGQSYTRQTIANTGLMTDQTPNLFFGLGDQAETVDVIIRSANEECRLNQIETNQVINISDC